VALNPATATIAAGQPASDIDVTTDTAIPLILTGTAQNPDAVVYVFVTKPAGGGGWHNNMPPYLGMHYIICVEGYFPDKWN